MAALQKFNNFGFACLQGYHRWDADHFKLMLTNVAPVAANKVFADVSAGEIGSGGSPPSGYPSGGGLLTGVSLTITGAVAKVAVADYTFTATGVFGPFRYGVIYNDDSGGKQLVGWFDHGASITLAATETFKVDFDASAGLFTLA